MGIPGLTTFVNKRVRLETAAFAEYNGVVVDGKSLIYHMTGKFKITCTFGGQYPRLESTLEGFFRALLSNRLQVVVVFDGIDYDDQKRATKLRRKKNWYSRIRNAFKENKELYLVPPLTNSVFCYVLRKLKIPYIFVDGDADKKITQIANFYHYPVIADDSDYYIFDLDVGYISLNKFKWAKGTVSALLYKRDFLVESAGFHSPDLVLGIPLFIGNDFYSPGIWKNQLDTLQDEPESGQAVKRNIAWAVDCLAQFSSLADCIQELPGMMKELDPVRVQKSISYGVDLMKRVYSAVPSFGYDPIAEMETYALMSQKDGRPVPKELLYFFRKGLVSLTTLEALCKEFVVLPAIFEDLEQPSCYNIGEPLRATLYALVHLDQDKLDIKEHVRCHPYNDNFTFASVSVNRSSVLPMVPSACKAFKEVCHLPLDTRKAVIMHCLEVPLSTAAAIQGLPCSFHLLAMVTRYWYHHAIPKPRPLELKALITCLLTNYSGIRHKVHISKFNQRTTHSCVQWQKVYMDVHDLNSLLSEPFLQLPPISELFDGQLLHFFTLQDEDLLWTYQVDRDRFHGLVLIASDDEVQKVTSVLQARETSVARHQATKTASSAPLHQVGRDRQHSQTTQVTNAQGRSAWYSQTTQAIIPQGQSTQYGHTTQATIAIAQGRSARYSQATQSAIAQGRSTQYGHTTQTTIAIAQGRSAWYSQAAQATIPQGQSTQYGLTTQATIAIAQGRSARYSQATQSAIPQGHTKYSTHYGHTTQATTAIAQGPSARYSQATQATIPQGHTKYSTHYGHTTQATIAIAQGRSARYSQATQATIPQGHTKYSTHYGHTTQATIAIAQGRSAQYSQAAQDAIAQGQSTQHSQTAQATNAEGRSKQHSQTARATNAQGRSMQRSRTTKAANAHGHSSLQRQPKAKKTSPAASSPHAHTKRHTNTSSVVSHTQPKQFHTPLPPPVPLSNRFALLTIDSNSSSSDSD